MSSIEIVSKDGIDYLYIDGVNWMEDSPAEVFMQRKLGERARGEVLVAGLGFGLYHEVVLAKPEVTGVTTVEKSQGVIDMMYERKPRVMNDPKHEVFCSDFFEWQTDKKFDTIYGDIWQTEDELNLWVKFKEKANDLIAEGGLIYGWLGDNFEASLFRLEKIREHESRRHRNI